MLPFRTGLASNLSTAHFLKREPTMLTRKKKLPSPQSPEVLKDYYSGKLIQMEKELNQFTLLENPREIRSLCCKIIIIKNMMRTATYH